MNSHSAPKVLGKAGDYLLISVPDQHKEKPAMGVIANTRSLTISAFMPLLMLFNIKQWDDEPDQSLLNSVRQYDGWKYG